MCYGNIIFNNILMYLPIPDFEFILKRKIGIKVCIKSKQSYFKLFPLLEFNWYLFVSVLTPIVL